MSLRDGTKKMSKSDPSDYSRINMTDNADAIVKKIRKAKTDPKSLPASVEEFDARPEAANLMSLYAALSETSIEDVCNRFGGGQFSAFKKQLADLAVVKLVPIEERMRRLMEDPAEVDRVLAQGGQRARELAEPTMKEIQDIVGFLRP
jgi:tryptophanyl-tRNA synthetase